MPDNKIMDQKRFGEKLPLVNRSTASKLRMDAFLVVQSALMLIAAAAGAFLGEYLKTRGKNLATKADFESLSDQLRASTEMVETIKAEIGQKGLRPKLNRRISAASNSKHS